MNCKPGDLAVIVRSVAGNDGRIVRCLRLATTQEVSNFNLDTDFHGRVWWRIDQRINATLAGRKVDAIPFAPDCQLRPIRDQPGADETLTWKPVPQPVPEKEQA